jgi:ATP-dependent Clp protease, protease subunit
MIDFNELMETANRRAALDRLSTYFIGDLTVEEAERFSKTMWIIAQSRVDIVRPEDKAVTIFLNSYGGDVSAGFAVMEMVNRLRREYQIPVTMIVTGVAYSMAAVVLQSASRRVMGELSTLMLHSPSWVLAGKDSQIFQDYERLADDYKRQIGRIFAERTGHKTAEWWSKYIYSERDRFLNAKECLEMKLVDEVTPFVFRDADPMQGRQI